MSTWRVSRQSLAERVDELVHRDVVDVDVQQPHALVLHVSPRVIRMWRSSRNHLTQRPCRPQPARSAPCSAGCCPARKRRTRSNAAPRRPHTHSMASFGGMAPEAKTDIAIVRQRPDREQLPVGVDAARHPEPDLVDVGAHDRILDADLLERVDEQRQVHGDEARLRRRTSSSTCSAKTAKDIVELQAEQQVGDHVLQEDDRRLQARRSASSRRRRAVFISW